MGALSCGVGLGAGVGGEAGADGKRLCGMEEAVCLFGDGRGCGRERERGLWRCSIPDVGDVPSDMDPGVVGDGGSSDSIILVVVVPPTLFSKLASRLLTVW